MVDLSAQVWMCSGSYWNKWDAGSTGSTVGSAREGKTKALGASKVADLETRIRRNGTAKSFSQAYP